MLTNRANITKDTAIPNQDIFNLLNIDDSSNTAAIELTIRPNSNLPSFTPMCSAVTFTVSGTWSHDSKIVKAGEVDILEPGHEFEPSAGISGAKIVMILNGGRYNPGLLSRTGISGRVEMLTTKEIKSGF